MTAMKCGAHDFACTPADYIVLIGIPIIMTLGIPGNILIMIAVLQRKFRNISTSLYLFTLAVSDMVCLFVNAMTNRWSWLIFDTTAYGHSTSLCRFVVFTTSISRCISAWMIVTLTIERFLLVMSAMKYKFITRQKVAGWILTIMVVTAFALHSHLLVMMDKDDVEDCDWKPIFKENPVRFYLDLIDLITFALLPSVILLVCNSYLTFRLWKMDQTKKSGRKVLISVINKHGGESGNNLKLQTHRHPIIMLILLSLTYIILSIPLGVYRLTELNLERKNSENDGDFAFYCSLYLLEVLNHAVNFYLYCLIKCTFIKDLTDKCCRKRNQISHNK